MSDLAPAELRMVELGRRLGFTDSSIALDIAAGRPDAAADPSLIVTAVRKVPRP